jgi:hypothetical protein
LFENKLFDLKDHIETTNSGNSNYNHNFVI